MVVRREGEEDIMLNYYANQAESEVWRFLESCGTSTEMALLTVMSSKL